MCYKIVLSESIRVFWQLVDANVLQVCSVSIANHLCFGKKKKSKPVPLFLPLQIKQAPTPFIIVIELKCNDFDCGNVQPITMSAQGSD